ncbi:MAG: hypothetical protein AAF378_09065 [Cyanobacteria bacterium P01_A01_bin.84]
MTATTQSQQQQDSVNVEYNLIQIYQDDSPAIILSANDKHKSCK